MCSSAFRGRSCDQRPARDDRLHCLDAIASDSSSRGTRCVIARLRRMPLTSAERTYALRRWTPPEKSRISGPHVVRSLDGVEMLASMGKRDSLLCLGAKCVDLGGARPIFLIERVGEIDVMSHCRAGHPVHAQGARRELATRRSTWWKQSIRSRAASYIFMQKAQPARGSEHASDHEDDKPAPPVGATR